MKKMILATLIGLLAVGTAGAIDRDQWLHVAVDGSGGDPEIVRVNLPMTLVEAVLPLIETDELHDGKIWLQHQELDHRDIVKILAAVRDAEDGEYVTVEDGSDYVRVAKEDDYLTIHVEERRNGGDRVDVRLPMSVLDALVSGNDDELDLLAAVRELGKHENEAFVTVREPHTVVRIWIDRDNQAD